MLIVCIVWFFYKDNVYIVGSMYLFMVKVVGFKIIIKKDFVVKINEFYVYIVNY